MAYGDLTTLAERPTAAASAASLSVQQSPQNNFYRVAGTNRTLKQQVVFTWDFVPLTNAVVDLKMKTVNGQLGKDVSNASQQFPQLLQNSAINGRAQINAGRELEIRAVPVTPSKK